MVQKVGDDFMEFKGVFICVHWCLASLFLGTFILISLFLWTLACFIFQALTLPLIIFVKSLRFRLFIIITNIELPKSILLTNMHQKLSQSVSIHIIT